MLQWIQHRPREYNCGLNLKEGYGNTLPLLLQKERRKNMPGFVTIEMLENKKGSPDGMEVKLYQKGEVYDLPSNGKDLLGDKFLARDLCKKVKKEEVLEEELITMDEEPEENTGEKSERKTMAEMAKEKLTGKKKDKKKK